jgi:hypothetical protein
MVMLALFSALFFASVNQALTPMFTVGRFAYFGFSRAWQSRNLHSFCLN